MDGLVFLILGTLGEVAIFFAAQVPTRNGYERSFGETVGFILFMSFFFLPMMYLGLAWILNTTVIRATPDFVTQKTGPIWLRRQVKFSASGLKQFFAVAAASSNNSQTYAANSVYLIDAHDSVWRLAPGLPSSFAANQICHELEDFYGIEDQPVYGVTTDPTHPGPRPKR